MPVNIAASLTFSKINTKPIISDLKNQLRNIKVDIDIGLDRGATTRVSNLGARLNELSTILKVVQKDALTTSVSIDKLARSFSGLVGVGNSVAGLSNKIQSTFKSSATSITQASNSINSFGERVQLAGLRFAAFTVAAGALFKFTQALRSGIGEALDFQRQLVRLAQVGGDSSTELNKVQDTITKVATTFGVSSRDLAEVSVTLRQAGIAGNELRLSLEAIGKASLAPTFRDINQIAEGSIAILRQFRLEASQLEGALDAINAVSAAYAVEADDLITAVQKTGGVFAALGGDLNQLISLFTSVRATTRESADTIATGFRTIFGRLQRPKVIDELRELNIQLRFTREEAQALGNINLTEQFVGPLEAIRRISIGLSQIQPTDPRFTAIIEQLGGVRQISKVIPLIREFTTTQEALNVAISSSGSITQSAATAQQALLVQVTKLKEEFLALFRAVGESNTFQVLTEISLKLARGLVFLADKLRPLLPLITSLAAVQVGRLLFNIPFVQKGVQAINPLRRSSGGFVPGSGSGDIVPAMLEPGEFVLRKDAARKLGGGALSGVNRMAKGGLFSRLFGSKKLTDQDKIDLEVDRLNKLLGFNTRSTFSSIGVRTKDQFEKLAEKTGVGTFASALGVFEGEDQSIGIRGSIARSASLPGILRHEVGHAVDFAGISDPKLFASQVPGAAQNTIARMFNGLLSTRKGSLTQVPESHVRSDPAEAFAEAFREFVLGLDRQSFRPEFQPIAKEFRKLFPGAAKFARGGEIPALLEPGEFVFNRQAVSRIGLSKLHDMNKGKRFHGGGLVAGYVEGGNVPNDGAVIIRLFLKNLSFVSDEMIKVATNLARLAVGIKEKNVEPRPLKVIEPQGNGPALPNLSDPRFANFITLPSRQRRFPAAGTGEPDFTSFVSHGQPIPFATGNRNVVEPGAPLSPRQRGFRVASLPEEEFRFSTRPRTKAGAGIDRGQFVGAQDILAFKGIQAANKAGIPLDAALTRSTVIANQQTEVLDSLIAIEQRAIQATNKVITQDDAKSVATERITKALKDNAQVLVSDKGQVLGLKSSVQSLSKAGQPVIGGGGPFGGIKDFFTNKFGPGLSGKFGKFATGGGLFALPLLSDLLDKVQGPITERSGFGAQLGKGFAGGISGGALTATLGASAGLSGKAIGALGAVGALLGFVDALQESENKIREIKVGEALEKVTQKLNDFATGAGGGNLSNISNDLRHLFDEIVNTQRSKKGLFELAGASVQDIFGGKTIGTTVKEEGIVEARQRIKGLSPQIAQALNRSTQDLIKNNISLINTGKTEIELRKNVGQVLRNDPGFNQLVTTLANNLGKPIDQVINEFEKLGVTVIRQTEIEKQRTIANEQTRLGVQAVSLFTQAIESASAATIRFDDKLLTIEENITGQFGTRTGRNFSQEVGTFGLRGNQFGTAIKDLLSPFNNLGTDIQETSLAFESIAKVLPNALASISGNLNQGFAPSDLVRRGVEAQLPNITGAQKTALSLIIAKLPEDLGEFTKAIKGGAVKFSQDLIDEAGAEINKAFKDLASQVDAHNQNVANIFARQRALQDQLNSLILERINSEEDLAKLQAQITSQRTGREPTTIFTPAVAEQFFRQRQATLVGPGLAGTNGADLVGERDRVRAQIRQLEEQRSRTPPGAAFDALTGNINELQQKFTNLSRAIDNTTNVNQRAAAINERLNAVQQERNRRLGTVEQFAKGDVLQRLEILRGVQLAGQFQKLGTPEERQQFVGGLNQQDFGRLLEQLPDRLKNLAVEAFAPDFVGAGGLKEEEKTLQDQLIKVQTEAITTQKALEESNKALLGEFQNTIRDKLITSQDALKQSIDNLRLSFETQKQAREGIKGGDLRELARLFPGVNTVGQLESIKQDLKPVQQFINSEENRSKLLKLEQAKAQFSDISSLDVISGTNKVDQSSLANLLLNRLSKAGVSGPNIDQNNINRFLSTQDLNIAHPTDQLLTGLNVDQIFRRLLNQLISEQPILDIPTSLLGINRQGITGESLNKLGQTDLSQFQANQGLRKPLINSQNANINVNQANVNLNAQGQATGGRIRGFASGGSTDTVPAMLTPGEFVINRASTSKFLPLLHAINSGGVGMRRGGRFFGSRNIVPSTGSFVSPTQTGSGPSISLGEGFHKTRSEKEIEQLLKDLSLDFGDSLSTFDTNVGGSRGGLLQHFDDGGLAELRGQQVRNLQLLTLLQGQRGFGGRELDIFRSGISSQLGLRNQDIERRILELNPAGDQQGRNKVNFGQAAPDFDNPFLPNNNLINPFKAAQIKQNENLQQNKKNIIERNDFLKRERQQQIIDQTFIGLNTINSDDQPTFINPKGRGSQLQPQGLSTAENSDIFGNRNRFTIINRRQNNLDPNLFRGRPARVGSFQSGGAVGGTGGSSNLGVDISKLSQGFAGFSETIQNFATTSSNFIQSILQFNQENKTLSEAMNNFPKTIDLAGRHTVEVIINGADVLAKLEPQIKQLIAQGTQTALNNLIKEKFTGLSPLALPINTAPEFLGD